MTFTYKNLGPNTNHNTNHSLPDATSVVEPIKSRVASDRKCILHPESSRYSIYLQIYYNKNKRINYRINSSRSNSSSNSSSSNRRCNNNNNTYS